MTPACKTIDVHQHIVPPFYLAEYRDRIAASRGGQITPAWLEWSPARALEAMDSHGIEKSIVSLSTPGVWFGDAVAAEHLARRCNDYAAGLVSRHPVRFGMFAAIALPAPDAALREIAYALDDLGADGIALLTNYDQIWLGDARYDPVFEELDRRRAVVFVHPTVPSTCRSLIPDIPAMIAEVPQDTARAVVNMLLRGTLTRFRNIRFIFAHAGGTLPMIAGRITQYAPPDLIEQLPGGVFAELRRHRYDIGGTANAPAMAALRAIAPIAHILFGSDGPFVPIGATMKDLSRLGLSRDDAEAIMWRNAAGLLSAGKANAR